MNSFITGDIKISLRYHFTPIRLAKLKILPRVDVDAGIGVLSSLLMGRQTGVALRTSGTLLPDETCQPPEFHSRADSLKTLSESSVEDAYKDTAVWSWGCGGGHHLDVWIGKVGVHRQGHTVQRSPVPHAH